MVLVKALSCILSGSFLLIKLACALVSSNLANEFDVPNIYFYLFHVKPFPMALKSKTVLSNLYHFFIIHGIISTSCTNS